jgi:undecaprenyl-diphosphatase
VSNTGDLWRRDPRPGVLVIVFGVAAAVFALLVIGLIAMPLFVFVDEIVSEAFRSLGGSLTETLARGATLLGNGIPMVVLTTGTVLVLWFTGRRAEAGLLLVTVAGGWLLGELFKEVFQRARPGLEFARIPLPESYSFPSGHALAAVEYFGTLAFIVILEAKSVTTRVWVTVLCAIAILVVSFSRVYLGVHWFGDILASWFLGVAWMALTISAYFWLTREKGA